MLEAPEVEPRLHHNTGHSLADNIAAKPGRTSVSIRGTRTVRTRATILRFRSAIPAWVRPALTV